MFQPLNMGCGSVSIGSGFNDFVDPDPDSEQEIVRKKSIQ
jgi:hypothetical protein